MENDAVDRVPDHGEALVNGDSHLPTPALSPITEHGHVADKEVQVDGVDEMPSPRPIAHENNHHNALTNGSCPPTTPRQQSGEVNGNQSSPDETDSKTITDQTNKTLKLSPAQIYKLTSSPGSIPFRAGSPILEEDIPPLDAFDNSLDPSPAITASSNLATSLLSDIRASPPSDLGISVPLDPSPKDDSAAFNHRSDTGLPLRSVRNTPGAFDRSRPIVQTRSNSSPAIRRKTSSTVPRTPADNREHSRPTRPALAALKLGDQPDLLISPSKSPQPPASSKSSVLPLPPLSLPTYLQLELSSDRPSALYINRSPTSDIPYESSKVKFERLLNFLLLPPQLEQTLIFGALACLDAWLYTFTILPLRFCSAVALWLQWGVKSLLNEAREITAFIYSGFGRWWRRQKQPSLNPSRNPSTAEPFPSTDEFSSPRVDLRIDDPSPGFQRPIRRDKRPSTAHRHRRTGSTPSALLPNHKADLLQGLLIIFSCLILLRFDASRIYHNIRGQSAIKLYVIYNSLEVFDRLFAAIGQDVLECLFSKETLERKPNGRSKVIRPFWIFMLALAYNVIHSAALFYQAITLNVAVNSYSNALLTLLLSNQFVEIKGSVFKKLEKENLFQMTCADVVERFQLWLMLLIIALRNIAEVGGLSMNVFGVSAPASDFNATGPSAQSMTFLPQAFTLVPKWSGQIMGPFFIVLGSEMLVDWLKHAYINKFNSIKPNIYGRYLDVLAKDYYSNAFVDQNLMKRLGLPVLPLACLFIRASVQTYHMFVASHMPLPIASTATALAVESASAETSPATTAALAHIDHIFRRALGRSSFGAGGEAADTFSWWSLDDVIAFATMVVFFLVLYLFLLAFKLVLGMCLLGFSRSRYRGMREREKQTYDAGSRRVGGWGAIEVDEEKRRWIYDDDEEGLRNLRAKEAKAREKTAKNGGEIKLDGVGRYMMVAKRIW